MSFDDAIAINYARGRERHRTILRFVIIITIRSVIIIVIIHYYECTLVAVPVIALLYYTRQTQMLK